jgi:sigma-B regulation protein RsbU (phosphoserine phosphatase)
MRRFTSLPKPFLAILATLLAAAMVLYSVLWMSSIRWQSPVELGFDNKYVESDHSQLVESVYPASPAEKAGLKAGDRIVAIYGRPITDDNSLSDVWNRHHPGDVVELTIKRPNVPAPLIVKGVFRAPHTVLLEGGIAQQLGKDIINTYPVAFLVVGLAVLFLRLEDPNAWLLALMFAGFIAVPSVSSVATSLGPTFRPFALAYRAIFDSLVGALFYFFFAVFPAQSPLDRRVPWLKWVGLGLGICVALPGLRVGDPRAPSVLIGLVGKDPANVIRLSYLYGFVALGLVSLVGNALGASTLEARRKIRVIVWGTLVGVVPATLTVAAGDFFGYHASLLLVAAVVLLLWLFPISFAYAVVKHRVLEIPVLLKRSARYLLVQRGFVFLHIMVSVAATVAFVWGLSRSFTSSAQFTTPMGLAAGVVFGSVLALGGLQIQRAASHRIDKAFFRNAYDARMILEDLVEKTRTATDREGLAALLERHLKQALQPASFAAYFETSDHRLSVASGDVPPELKTISAQEPLLLELKRHGKPWEVPFDDSNPPPADFILAPLHPDCLVPILGRDSRLVGLLVLGQRLSEELYSREDKQLLASIASQAGIALETIRMGENIAERIEAERHAAQEMEYAKQVQARLFPQKLPSLNTLEYVGGCIQARQVGGDYYDFLELRPGRVALVLADIAGKGISGALLMANLQANLRSQYATAVDDLPKLLKSVNQLFYENTSDSSYATLFFGDYDDSSRRLRYVNCGHLPPLLLRADGSLEHLAATATVLGLFEKWDCQTAEAQLEPGDLLVLYTDGVTEAANSEGEEFGETRLAACLRAHGNLPVASLLPAIVAAVQEYSGAEQADDITLVVARCGAGHSIGAGSAELGAALPRGF